GGTGPRGRNFDVLPYQKDLYSFMYENMMDVYELDSLGEQVLDSLGEPIFLGETIDLDQNAHIQSFRNEDGTINYNAIIDDNIAGAGVGYTIDDSIAFDSPYAGQLIGSNGYRGEGVNRSGMVRRASMNSHNWVGAISNLEYEGESLTASLGIDLRHYKGFHYRVLNHLMGFDGYYSGGNENNVGSPYVVYEEDENGNEYPDSWSSSAGTIIDQGGTVEASPFSNTGLSGPKMDYFNIGIVKWAGLNGMVEYKQNEDLTAVVQAGVSNQSYQRIDYFDSPGNSVSEVASIGGGYIKGGANYNMNESSNVFINAGLISRQPNFDAVFPNYSNNVNDELENEKIQSLEVGYGYVSDRFDLNVNAYATTWGNRFFTTSVPLQNSTDNGTAQFSGIDVQHNGIEVETNYYPMDGLKVTGMLSLGDWRYTTNFEATVFDEFQNATSETAILYTEGAKVGDAAQTVANLGLDYQVNPMISVDLGARYVDGLYADYNAISDGFLDPENRGAMQLPSYSLIDFGTTARFDLLGTDASFRINVNNLLDTEYIAESNSNIHAEDGSDTWNGVDTRNFVWFGFGRTWNASLKLNF
ncbi:MAG: hypothetical protein ACPG08_07315, partial [Flavobacteriales bacterium]